MQHVLDLYPMCFSITKTETESVLSTIWAGRTRRKLNARAREINSPWFRPWNTNSYGISHIQIDAAVSEIFNCFKSALNASVHRNRCKMGKLHGFRNAFLSCTYAPTILSLMDVVDLKNVPQSFITSKWKIPFFEFACIQPPEGSSWALILVLL